MKKILLILAMFTAMCSYAQEPLWWGYFSESDVSGITGIGTGQKENFEAALFIPANHPIVGGATIKSLRIWFDANTISKFTSLKVWISKKLGNNAAGADYVQQVSVSSLKGGVNEIALSTPYSVDNKAIYVGYTLGLSDAVYSIMCGGNWCENSFFIRSSVNVTDWGPLSSFGKLAMMLLLDGAVVEENAAAPADFGTAYALKGSNAKVPITITNVGSKPLKSISYTITTNGETTEEKTVQAGNIAFNESGKVNIEFAADKEARKYEKTLTITKVNGVANPVDKKSATGALITILEKPVVVPVVEEFTGTWCGWCTVGYDGMERAYETFGDKVALIAVHNGDPMEISDYSSIASRADGYPSSLIDRDISAYPSAGNLDYYLNWQLENKVAVADLQVSASWNSLKRTISIDTKTRFVYSDENGNYGIAYVLVEDGMSGKTSNWAQANYLSGNDNYKDLEFWYNSPSKVSGIQFNHVAVAAWNIADGVKNSVNPVIQAGEEQTFSYKANISTNTNSLIQDKSKLKLVALLIDRSTGLIVNAAQTTIADYNPTSIESPNSVIPEDEGAIYNISGQRVQKPQKGIYIQNGKKVLFK